eukprot:gnl/MRDRNA2_/MRDRNA2_195805_c0_seq1.p1 gnl/MRDRNA2_/MRDRNA2_195805_c0~~gnl/MRDRNA2_/MRDRNA2_195805_c0_seq1.p1  ORF type:complete len:419 (-),score=76.17 gnl/MRDRNA2_/MRDRNA2_195805_c0_seq1:11-1267(-)
MLFRSQFVTHSKHWAAPRVLLQCHAGVARTTFRPSIFMTSCNGIRNVANVNGSTDSGGFTRKVVDLRSDTLTTPTEEMREAMLNAVVGDDVYKEDPTILELQEHAAKLFRKEAALFVTSGTMGNLISILAQCERGCEVLVGEQSHCFIWEQGGMAQIGGVHPRPVKQFPDGRLDLDDLANKVRGDDPHWPITRVVCIENTFYGSVLKPDYIKQVAAFCKERGLLLHCDGARIFNAAVALDLPVHQVAEDCDSVTFCLSKALGAPVGSMIVGSTELIRKAHRMRKVLGGAMRQVGVIGAPALLALEQGPARLKKDHENCKRMAENLKQLPGVASVADPDSNIILFSLSEDIGPPTEFVSACASDDGSCCVKLLHLPGGTGRMIRVVMYHQISSEDVDLALAKISHVMAQAVAKQRKSHC